MRELQRDEDAIAIAPGQSHEAIQRFIATQACQSIHGVLPCLK
ncbi:MAG TPA: hypothetical protein VGL09_17695 [Methylomirabilota bacterium]|jgi:hypothetical protein